MSQNTDGEWWPPKEVEQMVKDHYLQAQEAGRVISSLSPPDYDAFEENIYAWESGPMREQSLLLLEAYREHRSAIAYAEYEESAIETYNWNEDGSECTVRFVGSGWRVYEHDPATGDLIGMREREEDLRVSILMRYDPQTGHWRAHEMVEYATLDDGQNAATAEAAISEFVHELHIGDVESAYLLLDEEAQAQQSAEEFATVLATDPNMVFIESYQNLEVCEALIVSGEFGPVLTSAGLLHYGGGDLYFASYLRQDSQGVWRILAFRVDSDIEPEAWGACSPD